MRTRERLALERRWRAFWIRQQLSWLAWRKRRPPLWRLLARYRWWLDEPLLPS